MKIKTTLLGFALLFAMQTMMAQYKISGSIQDEKTKEPLVGVSIYITDLKTGTLSNMEGYYQIDKIKPGRYLLDISAVGYKSMVKQITVRSDTSIHFILTPSVNELNEAIVTGVSRSTELKKSPVIVKTIDRTTMMQNSATNLIDALKNVPGMSQISTGASISKPVIRGLGYNRLITLNNGIRQEGQQWGDEHGIEMDEYAIDRVEIVKGPGSLMYGSDGIAGVLNFLAPKFPSKGDIKTQLISNYQSNNQLIGYSLSNTGNQKGIQWLGRMSTKWAANYQNDNDGKVLNSGFREMDVSLMGGVNKSWGHSHLSISSFQQQLNLPEGERDSLGRFTFVNAQGEEVTATSADYSGYKTGYPHQDIHHVRLSSNNYFILRKGTLQADFGFQNNKRKEFGNPADPNEIDLYFDLRTINYSIRYHAEEIKGWETSLGIGGMQQSHVNKGVDFLIPAYQLLDAGAFVYTQKSFRKCTIAGGVRLDLRSVRSEALYLDSLGQAVSEPDAYSELKFSPISRSYEGFSGSLGVSYAMNTSSTFKLNLSRGFRAPNIA
ncbi:MAG TPA: carboxypeptidase-like regulatory domain-containing protein, partial [Chitinophagaceae bacterium]|nr:carboxypeptidase-like regulatory domain-containing protein [Chitinophagaceae bacterium]